MLYLWLRDNQQNIEKVVIILISLQNFAEQLTAQSEVMEGREKGEMESLIGVRTTISNYDFLNGDDGEYVVFTVKEDPKNFFFGGSILTEHLKEMNSQGYREAIQNEGLPVTFNKKVSKQNRTYTNVTFFPKQ